MKTTIGGVHGGKSRDRSTEEAEFSFGHFYRTIEEHIESFATQEGSPFTVSDVALRVGQLLQGQALREQLRNPELVSEVRKNGARSGLSGATLASSALHVRPFSYGALRADGRPRKRVLSAKAIKAISVAQRKRWAKFHATNDGKLSKRAGWRAKSPEARQKSARAVERALGKGSSSMKSFWASMTPEERSKEMLRRRRVAEEKRAKAS